MLLAPALVGSGTGDRILRWRLRKVSGRVQRKAPKRVFDATLELLGRRRVVRAVVAAGVAHILGSVWIEARGQAVDRGVDEDPTEPLAILLEISL